MKERRKKRRKRKTQNRIRDRPQINEHKRKTAQGQENIKDRGEERKTEKDEVMTEEVTTNVVCLGRASHSGTPEWSDTQTTKLRL